MNSPSLKSMWIVAGVPVLCLLPFINKAFHIDDPWYLWSAFHILKNPFDFYGFEINWYGYPKPMIEMAEHPPGFPYLLAGIAFLFGIHEWAFHLVLLIPAAAFGWGTWRLASRMCSRPVLAALIAVASPALLVSATTVMPDLTMTALYLWAVITWVEGTENENPKSLLASSFLIAAACMMKIFAVSLIPLLFAYSWIHHRRPGYWAVYFLVPVIALALYYWTTFLLYGHSLHSDLLHNFLNSDSMKTFPSSKTFQGISFLGGGFLGVLFFLPCLWARRQWVSWAVFFIFCFIFIEVFPVPGWQHVWPDQTFDGFFAAQYTLFVLGGVHLLVLAIEDLRHRRDANSWLLAFWIFGTFIFASNLNWSVTIRALLPLAPVTGILVARRLDFINHESAKENRYPGALLAALGISLWVSYADYSLAESDKKFVLEHAERLQTQARHNLWFQGHWGFQYYMEEAGAKPLHFFDSQAKPGDILVDPMYNTNVNTYASYPLLPYIPQLKEIILKEVAPWLGVSNYRMGTGFHSGVYGPLPFAFGRVSPSKFKIYTIIDPG